MKRLVSIGYTAGAFNFAMLLLRIGSGLLLMKHGYDKLVGFKQLQPKITNFMGLGSTVSLSLAIFAEFFCAIFLIIGLFTRVVSLVLVCNMAVAVFVAHKGDVFATGEKASLYLLCFLITLLCGPGRASVDGMMR